MRVEYTPNEEEVYRLVDDDGTLIRASNRRRDLVREMESGRVVISIDSGLKKIRKRGKLVRR